MFCQSCSRLSCYAREIAHDLLTLPFRVIWALLSALSLALVWSGRFLWRFRRPVVAFASGSIIAWMFINAPYWCQEKQEGSRPWRHGWWLNSIALLIMAIFIDKGLSIRPDAVVVTLLSWTLTSYSMAIAGFILFNPLVARYWRSLQRRCAPAT